MRDRYELLSHRERQVLALVASGLLNKQIGGELGISEITVKAHRGKVMRKMQAPSLASLVRMAEKLGLDQTMRRYAASAAALAFGPFALSSADYGQTMNASNAGVESHPIPTVSSNTMVQSTRSSVSASIHCIA